MGQGTLQPGAGARWTCQGVDKVGHAEFPPCKRLRDIRRECAIAQPHANEHTPHQTNQGTRAFRFRLLSGGPSAQLIAVSLPHSEYGSAYVRHRAVAVATRVVSCACTPVAVVSTRSNSTRLQGACHDAALLWKNSCEATRLQATHTGIGRVLLRLQHVCGGRGGMGWGVWGCGILFAPLAVPSTHVLPRRSGLANRASTRLPRGPRRGKRDILRGFPRLGAHRGAGTRIE